MNSQGRGNRIYNYGETETGGLMGERKRERCHSSQFPFDPSNGSFLVATPHVPLSIHYKGCLHSFWEDVVKNLRIHP